MQAEAVRGQAPVRYIVSDAAALCAHADATDQRLMAGSVAAAEGSNGSTASGTHGYSVSPEDMRANIGADRTVTATAQRAVGRTGNAAFSAKRLEGDRLLSPGSFDTVVDTFGLCSHADPVAVLQVSGSPTFHSLFATAKD